MMERELTELRTEKDKMEEIMDQTKTAMMLNELQCLQKDNKKLSKDKFEVSIFMVLSF